MSGVLECTVVQLYKRRSAEGFVLFLITLIRPFFYPSSIVPMSTLTVPLQGAQTFLQSAPPCARLLGFPDLVPSVTVVLLSKVCFFTEGISEVTKDIAVLQLRS